MPIGIPDQHSQPAQLIQQAAQLLGAHVSKPLRPPLAYEPQDIPWRIGLCIAVTHSHLVPYHGPGNRLIMGIERERPVEAFTDALTHFGKAIDGLDIILPNIIRG